MRFYGFETLLALLVVANTALSAQEALQLKSATVSVNKIEEEIKDIPQSVSVIDEAMIEEKGIKNIADVANEIPNFNLPSLFTNQSNFRGINSSLFTNNNPLAIYVDGVPQSNRYGYNVSLANVERIEVLRGPQGALYGKDSIGGVINIITKTPRNEWQGRISTEYGSYSTMHSTFNTSGALIKDKLFLGLNGDYTKSDGWIENENPKLSKHADASKEHNFNFNATYKPTDNFTAKLSISRGTNNRNFAGELLLIPEANNYKRKDAKKINSEAEIFTDTTSNTQALILHYETDALRFSSITSHEKVDLKGKYSPDYNNNNPTMRGLKKSRDANAKTITQELRLTSKESSGFRYIGGLYFEHEKIDNRWYGKAVFSHIPSPIFPLNSSFDIPTNTTTTTKAIFAQNMIPLGSSIELTLGGRYQIINKEMSSDTYIFPDFAPKPDIPEFHLDLDQNWKVFLPKVALSYKINDEWMSYATVSKGYLPGGFSFFPKESSEQHQFKPQTSINYELGFHAHTLGNRLRLSSALFYMDIKDIHIFSIKPDAVDRFVIDSSKAVSKGIELEALYRATEKIDLNVALGVISTKYGEYKVFPQDYKNNKVENTPSFNLKLGATYTNPSGFYARGDVRFQGKTYYNPSNTVYNDTYSVADTKLGYRFGNWDLYAYGKNITNTDYIVYTQEDISGTEAFLALNRGRELGIGGQYRF